MEYVIAGAIGGFCEYLVGHPLDTLKVKMQVTNKSFFSTIHSMNGFRNLWNGLTPSLASAMIRNGCLFGVYGNVLEAMPYNNSFGVCTAGFISGIISTCIFSPTDLIKIRLQTKESSSLGNVMSDIYKKDGLRGFGHGGRLTLARESFGCAMYYGIYDKLKKSRIFGFENSINNFMCGASTGWISFITFHPIDVVKSRYQASEKDTVKRIIKDIWIKEGINGFWRGSLPLTLRVIPSSAVLFVVYEKVLDLTSNE